ncbi:HAD-IIB family hydrolase [Faecalicoccus pleomorphus]|uniref:HAD-IIB family hydrolase n=1 Tax=Faecalicoccus pleomorphus TaxID=1323 RepID=UPI0019610B79|nr:HAD-IIB family hydrolase [Faecalicoccus pleomorphus]MBM6807736.1 HAD-IIB family hydrolase [Faecalicoccus pleomorphus]
MKRWIVCDLDGSLMPPSDGLYVSKAVQEKLIALQEKGNTVILNSARVFQGVYPLALQIGMDTFGGYLISSNGSHVYDMRTKQVIDCTKMDSDQVLWLWQLMEKHNIGIGFTQPEAVICSQMRLGFELDQKNCDIDYITTMHPTRYLRAEVVKCSVAAKPEELETVMDALEPEIGQHTDFQVIRSTPTLYDVLHKEVSKQGALEKLLKSLHADWDQVTVIGDGYSDVESIRLAALGCTLENAKEECKEVADMIVPSCYEDGCLIWLDRLLEETYESH